MYQTLLKKINHLSEGDLFFSTLNNCFKCLIDRWMILREIHNRCVNENSHCSTSNTRSDTRIANLVRIPIKECHLSTHTASFDDCLECYTSLRSIFVYFELPIHDNIESICLITLPKECLMWCENLLFAKECKGRNIIRSQIAEERVCFESITHSNYFLITSLYASNVSPTSGFVSPL